MGGIFWFIWSPLLDRLWPRISDYRIRFVDVSFHKTSAPPSSGRRDCPRRTRSSRRRNLNFVSFVNFVDKNFRVLRGCSFVNVSSLSVTALARRSSASQNHFTSPTRKENDEAINYSLRTYGAHLFLSRARCGQGPQTRPARRILRLWQRCRGRFPHHPGRQKANHQTHRQKARFRIDQRSTRQFKTRGSFFSPLDRRDSHSQGWKIQVHARVR